MMESRECCFDWCAVHYGDVLGVCIAVSRFLRVSMRVM